MLSYQRLAAEVHRLLSDVPLFNQSRIRAVDCMGDVEVRIVDLLERHHDLFGTTGPAALRKTLVSYAAEVVGPIRLQKRQ